MKKIVVPVDFSEESVRALRYAITIANAFGSSINVINGIDTNAATSIYTDVRTMMRSVAERKLADLIEEESDRLSNGASLSTGILHGDTSSGICDYADEVDADLIIMGTKGATGLKEIFIGSVAQGVINAAKQPVLVIPKKANIEPPTRVALTLDDQELSSAAVVEPLKILTKAFDCYVQVFHYNKGFVTTDVDPRIDHYLNDIEFSFHEEYASEKNIVKVIDEFVEEEGIELLVMVRHQRSFWDNLFHSSATSKEIFHSKVPVLILHDSH